MRYTYAAGDKPLDGFTVQAPLGRGGFGEVYRAISDGGKQVALKHVQAYWDVELRGVGHCMNLKHPNLLSLFDVRQTPGEDYWVVMEYVAGESLDKAIDARPQGMPRELAIDWLQGICAAVGYLHDNGIVHRDLKPANVFLDQGIVKVGDYGLSKFITASRRSGQTGSIGTVHYVAPEVAKGRYGREIDLYSIGIMFYEMLTGRVPFTGETASEILMKHLTQEPDLRPIPEELRPLMAKLLAKDPADRYHHVTELLTDLGITLPTVLTPSLWRGEVAQPSRPRLVLPETSPVPRSEAPSVLPAADLPPSLMRMPFWLRLFVGIVLGGGVGPFVGGVVEAVFGGRGDFGVLAGLGLSFCTLGLTLILLRSWALRAGWSQPDWLRRSGSYPKRLFLDWFLSGAVTALGVALFVGGFIDYLTRRDEVAALMAVAVGMLTLAAALVYQAREARALRQSLGVLGTDAGPWVTGMLRIFLAVLIGAGAGHLVGGAFTFVFPRSEGLAVLFATCVGTLGLSLTLFGFGMRMFGGIMVGAMWAIAVGLALGMVFGEVFRNEDAGIAVGVGAGILNFSLVVVGFLWYRGRKLRHSSHRGLGRYGRAVSI